MNTTDHKATLIDNLKQSLSDDTFVKLSLGNYRGDEPELKNIYIKKFWVKQGHTKAQKFSFNYRYKTKDQAKTYLIEEGMDLMQTLVAPDGFRVLTLMTTTGDYTFEYLKGDKTGYRKGPATHTTHPSEEHDRQKQKLITAQDKKYLTALRITDESGNVYKATQDKYKQINHYIEILSSLLRDLPQHELLRVADMGAGKGYLTFALYDYVTSVLARKTTVTGVEYRNDLVKLCNDISEDSGFDGLRFVQSTIQDYDCTGMNVLIALHACDTATDDAIYKGITAGADLIVVAPCCHKQIRREMEAGKAKNELSYLTKHGIFMERQAEMVTDGIRALVLEYFGYSTKVIDFVSDAHTPKNVMLIGEKRSGATANSEDVLKKISEAKDYFGIRQHYLEKVMGI